MSVADCLEQVRLVHRNTTEGVTSTDLGDRAFVAVQASVMTDLQEERSVSKLIAPLDAFGATDAESLVNRIFVVWILDVGSPDRRSGALAILRTGIQVVWRRLKVAGAELAVSAHRERVHALDR
jgi:hypothetical protein